MKALCQCWLYIEELLIIRKASKYHEKMLVYNDNDIVKFKNLHGYASVAPPFS